VAGGPRLPLPAAQAVGPGLAQMSRYVIPQ